jgi:phosphoglycerol transferase MdoB-like AlkP superfamily enzyme
MRHRDVFLILDESFNARFVETYAPNGKPYTPFLNSILAQGLYVERFYGNSIQTAKGQFSTLCSLSPSMSKEFGRFANDHLNCLPRVLKQTDYFSVFFQAYKEINFDNTHGFLQNIGFDRVESVVTHQHPGDEKETWGWGLQDDVFFRRFFEYLDETERAASAARPLFVTLAPISNHMRFDEVPKGKRAMYAEPSKPEECFANTVHIADQGLRVFFEELRKRKRYDDAIVVITGDHSFPVGEHGFYHNEVEAFDEFFRVPLLVIAPNLIVPERVSEVPYSQLDIAPTLLELTNTKPALTHFVGESLLAKPRKVHPIPLVQPYGGEYYAVVEYPFKYIHHLETDRGRLFDLSRDPKELNNLASDGRYQGHVKHLRGLIRQSLVVDAALENDLVWPKTE